MEISIVIPTFNRLLHLKNTINSVLQQKKLPFEVIVVDNAEHDLASKVVDESRAKFSDKGISILYVRNTENSSATARNLGASMASSELIAFLDDDVILDDNYYEEIEQVFNQNPDVLGVQGYDNSVRDLYYRTMKNPSGKLIYLFEKLFMTSFFFEKNRSRVLPSLCVTCPAPDFDQPQKSQWISTCAGVFSRSVFENHEFEKQFKKYCWNDYVDFSYPIYVANPDSLFWTSKATYLDVQTGDGRLPPKELIYMAEVYDLFIFLKRFDTNFYNISIYIWSKLGKSVYNILKIIVKNPSQYRLIFDILNAPFYALVNISKIKQGDLGFFNKTLT